MNLRRHSVGIGPFAANAKPSADRGVLSEEAFHAHDFARTAENGALAQTLPADVARHRRPRPFRRGVEDSGQVGGRAVGVHPRDRRGGLVQERAGWWE